MHDQTPLDSVAIPVESQFEYAENWKRFVNFIIDYVIIILIFAAIAMASSIQKDSAIYIIVYAVFFTYYTSMEYIFGRTVGKFITGTIVIREADLEKISLSQALGRSITRFVPFEVFSLIGSQLGWHDKWTNTAVVKKSTLTKGNI
ncbi:MAG: RDD family protein [Chitinophagales bacterium]